MRQPANTCQDLIVWQKAHEFVLSVYRITGRFPKTEIYGLTSQLRRSAVSIPANIAEAFKKRGRADKGRFLNIAQGSLEESRYYLLLTQDLGYYDCSQALEKIEEVSKLLSAYCCTILKDKP
jgi:four helix bundle protein